MSRPLPTGFVLGAATLRLPDRGCCRPPWRDDLDPLHRAAGSSRRRVAMPVTTSTVSRAGPRPDGGARLEAYRFSSPGHGCCRRARAVLIHAGSASTTDSSTGCSNAASPPWLTLYHWDLPQHLEDVGGWRSRATVGRFTDYASLMADTLGDRVVNWITHNEPWVASMLGHRDGVFAPGGTDMTEALTVAHHLLVSHGAAAQAIRSHAPAARIAIAVDCRPAVPATDREPDVEATAHFDGFRNRCSSTRCSGSATRRTWSRPTASRDASTRVPMAMARCSRATWS